jgi:hypothetical protein
MPSLCIAPVFSLEMWLMIVVSCSSGSGSLTGGEGLCSPCPFTEDDVWLVRAGEADRRWSNEAEDAVRGGEIGRLSKEGDAASSRLPFDDSVGGASAPTRVLEFRIRYTYGYTMVAEGSSKDEERRSYTSSP